MKMIQLTTNAIDELVGCQKLDSPCKSAPAGSDLECESPPFRRRRGRLYVEGFLASEGHQLETFVALEFDP
jgi:hypothetical protein